MFSRKRFFNSMFAVTAGLVCVIGQPVHAQVEAADQFANPLPESGRWFTNDGSRTGFFIEVQNGIVAGLYVGGDANGDNAWASFSGVLQPGATTDVEAVWILDTDLLRFAGTGCIIDCMDAAVGESSFEVVGDIRIDFRGRSQAMVWIDDQPVREIAPIYFGVERTEINRSAPPVFLPELEGKWVVARASSGDFPDSYSGAAVIEIGPRTSEPAVNLPEPPPDDEFAETVYINPIVDDPDDFFPEDSSIRCTVFEDRTVEPRCFIDFRLGPMEGLSIDFDTITDTRLTVIQPSDVIGDAAQFQLFRLNHD